MRKVGVVALLYMTGLVGCAATQEGPALPDARTSQSLTPDAPDACVPSPEGELCNGHDDNCNGTIDEGFELGKACTNGLGTCERPGKTICAPDGQGVICDAVAAQPLPLDLCHNGIDDNCDGHVDEGFDAWGTICFAGTGDCKQPGVWTCNPAGDSLVCDAVPGAPKPELCGTGHDENCNGTVDEGFPDLGQECKVGVGHCKANGTRICDPTDLTKTRCSAAPADPEPESCNGIDDNCDGRVDENDPGGGAGCLTGSTGECGPGHLHCIEGRLACVPDHIPAPEVCDGKDNDCDGIIDNGFGIGQACDGSDSDFCPRGHLECATLFGTQCVDDGPNTPELCNGVDDNCDGRVDENWDFFNDADNCGGCNDVCSGLNVDVRRCSSGACDPTCSFGWQSCDGNLANGCETLRNTYGGDLPQPTETLASVSGDEGRDPATIFGFGETQIRVQVREDSDGLHNLHAQFRLQNPDGVQMHLCVSGGHCGGFGSFCTGAAADQSIWASADETPWPLSCNDDTFDVNVEVIFDGAERTSCGQWTLTIYSHSDPPDGAPNIDVD